jgi:Zn-dependent alcohol dehydrogenase
LKKCAIIIGIDRFQERLDMAKELGATHVIDTTSPEVDLVEKVKALTSGNGSSLTIDTTGNMSLIENGMNFTANRGQMIILGVPPVDAILNVHLITFMQVSSHWKAAFEADDS